MMKQKPAHGPHVYIAEMAESYNGETKNCIWAALCAGVVGLPLFRYLYRPSTTVCTIRAHRCREGISANGGERNMRFGFEEQAITRGWT